MYKYLGLTRCAGTAAWVEAPVSAEAEVLATTPEALAETQGALEAEAVARERRAVPERMAPAEARVAVLVAGLVERSLPVVARRAPLPEAVVVAARQTPPPMLVLAALGATGKSRSGGPERRAEVLRRR